MELRIDLVLASRVRTLERQVRATTALVGLLLLAMVAVVAAGWTRAQEATKPPAADRVMRLRGLVIEDDSGRPRVVLGAPVATLAGRRRSDRAIGMMLLDENGRDRLQPGNDLDAHRRRPAAVPADGSCRPPEVGVRSIGAGERARPCTERQGISLSVRVARQDECFPSRRSRVGASSMIAAIRVDCPHFSTRTSE